MKMYFLAVLLPPELNSKILALKKWMHQKWGCKAGLKSPAHTTLVPPFWMDEKREEDLKKDMDVLSSGLASFEVATANFSCFTPRTFFIQPVLDAPLASLKKEADAFFSTRPQYGAKIDSRPFHPHITIATRDLRKSAFAEAWPQFENQAFQQTFTAGGISLLRHSGQAWEVVHTAAFGK